MQGSLPAGWLAFTGRESNPLDRDERFQITCRPPFLDFSCRNGSWTPSSCRTCGSAMSWLLATSVIATSRGGSSLAVNEASLTLAGAGLDYPALAECHAHSVRRIADC